MNPDFADFRLALIAMGARFLVIGAHTAAVHGVVSATDIEALGRRPAAE